MSDCEMNSKKSGQLPEGREYIYISATSRRIEHTLYAPYEYEQYQKT